MGKVCGGARHHNKMWSVSYFISVRSDSGVQIEFPIDFKVIMEKVFGRFKGGEFLEIVLLGYSTVL